MLEFFYSTEYHPDGYMVGRVYVVLRSSEEDCIYEVFHTSNWEPTVVRSYCWQFIQDNEV